MPDDAPEPAKTRAAKLPRKPPRVENATTADATPGTKPVGTTPVAKTTDATPAQAPDVPFAAPSGYEFVRRLGEGGMGVVFEARDLRAGNSVALKTISDRRPAKMPDVIRFLSEAEVQAAITHDNVVRVFKVGEWGGRPYMIMEYLPGGSLAERLAGERLKPKKAASLVRRITCGVAAAHTRGIFHRDLKPANILFNEAGEPKVADFGLAKRDTSDLTQTGALMGTPAYMAPEQANGRNALVGAATDVWALGVILYECLTGHRPFKSDSGHVALAITMDEPPSILKKCPDAPRDLERICLKCLEKDPKDRYPSAAELLADLEAQAAGKPIGAKRPSWVDRAFKWARKRPTAVAIWGLATLAIALGSFTAVAVSLWQSAETERNDAVGARNLADQLKSEAVNSRDQLADQKSTADKLRVDAETAREALGKANYFRVLDLAWRAHLEGNLSRAKQLLAEIRNETKHHGWEWGFVSRRINPETVAFEPPPGRSAGEQYESMNFTPDGKHLIAVASRPKDRARVQIARTWNAATGKFEHLIPAPDQGEAASVIVSYEGRVAVVSMSNPKPEEFGQLRVYDTATAKEVCRLNNAHIPVCCAESSPDGKMLAVHFSFQAGVREGPPVAVPAQPKLMPKAPDPKPAPNPDPKPMPRPKGDAFEQGCEAQDKKKEPLEQVPEPRLPGTQPQPTPGPVPAAPAFAADGHLAVFEIATSKSVRLDQANGQYNLLGFILEGREILVEEYGKESVRLVAWNLKTGDRRVLAPELAIAKPGESNGVVSQDGSLVAVILKTGKAAVFELAKNRIVREFEPATATPAASEAAPKSRLALGDFSGDGSRVTLWTIRSSGKPNGSHRTAGDRIEPILEPDSAVLVTHDILNGRPVRTKTVQSVGIPNYSPDGRWRFDCAPRIAGEDSRFLRLHDDTTNRVRTVPLGRLNSQYQLAFAPDSRRLAITREEGIVSIDLDASDEAAIPGEGWRPLGYGANGAEYLVGESYGSKSDPSDSDSPRGVFTSYDARTGALMPVQHVHGPDTKFAFFRDGNAHVSEKRGEALIVRIAGDTVARSIRLSPGVAGDLLWCANGRNFFTSGSNLGFWDAQQGLELWKRPGSKPLGRVWMQQEREAVRSELVPVQKQRTVKNESQQLETQVYTTYEQVAVKYKYVVTVQASPPCVSDDGSLVALVPDVAFDPVTGNPIKLADGTDEISVLDGKTGKELGRIPFETAPSEVVFSADSKKLAILSGDRAFVYDAGSLQRLYSMRTSGREFASLAFSPDGTRIATGTGTGLFDNRVKDSGGLPRVAVARSAADERLQLTIWDAADGREIFTIPIDDEGGAGYRAIRRIDFHPQGSQLAVSTTKKTILLNAVAP